MDETTARAHLVIPDLTPLESWGDYSPRAGVWGLLQPAMAPVPKVGSRRIPTPSTAPARGRAERAGTEGSGDVPRRRDEGGRATSCWTPAARWSRDPRRPSSRPRPSPTTSGTSWRAMAKTAAPKASLRGVLGGALRRGGYWADVPAAKVALRAGLKVAAQAPALEGNAADPALLLVVPSSRYDDGRGANKVWLHETPDPMTQVVYGELGRGRGGNGARARASSPGDVLKVESPHGSHRGPGLRLGDAGRRARWPSRPGSDTPRTGRFARGVGQSPYALLPGRADRGLRRAPLAGRPGQAPEDRAAREARLAGRRDRDRPLAGDLRDGRRSRRRSSSSESGKAPEHANLPSMYPDLKYPAEPLGHGDRPRRLHGLPGVRGGLPGREQRALGREGRHRLRAEHPVAPRRAVVGPRRPEAKAAGSRASLPGVTGVAHAAEAPGRRPGPARGSSRCCASTARSRPASRCARCSPPTTHRTG